MSDVNNLLHMAKIFFAASTREIRARREPDRLPQPHLDQADHANIRRDRISLQEINKTVYAIGSKRLNWSEKKAGGPTITNETAA